jgi:hypothetical protein
MIPRVNSDYFINQLIVVMETSCASFELQYAATRGFQTSYNKLIHVMQCRQINYEVKTVVFCSVAPCSLKKAGRRFFRGGYYLHHHPERQLSSYS